MILRAGALSAEIILNPSPHMDRFSVVHHKDCGDWPEQTAEIAAGKTWYPKSDAITMLRRLAADAEALAKLLGKENG